MNEEVKADHERIWLQPLCCASESEGRLWCQDKVWPEGDCDEEPTEYVRADLARTPAPCSPDVVELRRELFELERRGLSYASGTPAVNMLLADLSNGLRKAADALETMMRLPPARREKEAMEQWVADAYKRGWQDGCETLLEDYYISGKPETPHKDEMGEGCGDFMAEFYAATQPRAALDMTVDKGE